ncbi:transcriptional regulator [Natrinema sp. CBA1119]|nr:transcriptional regulator [Natrinema sp. CBA1119]
MDEQADDRREVLNLVTQETRFILIQNIVAHPEGMPSLKEIVYANPSKSKSTIRNHLDKLMDAGIVEGVELPKDERQRDLPYRFYQLTQDGQNLLEKYDLLRAEETLQEMHSMLEKTPQIQKYMDAPRPGDFQDDAQDEDNSRRLIEQ